MKAWARHDHLDRPVTTCRFCREPIVLVEDVGWIVDERSGSYDMCEVNPLGNHNPDDNWRSTGVNWLVGRSLVVWGLMARAAVTCGRGRRPDQGPSWKHDERTSDADEVEPFTTHRRRIRRPSPG